LASASDRAALPSQISSWFAQVDPINLALRLTLLDLLLRPVGDWRVRPFVLILAAGGLLAPGLLRKPGLWLALAFLAGLRIVLDWPLSDNHAYLLSYWCLAVFLALLAEDPQACLALNGRLLIGCVFAFAVLWKLALSPDYLDGTFFRVTLLTDPRFEGFARLVGGLTPDRLAELRAFVNQHVDGQAFGWSNTPTEPARFLTVAWVVTFWTIAIELATALAFLWPVGRGISRLRNAFLVAFCATIYAVATVEGFGWLLISAAVAQCPAHRPKTRLLYVAAFGLLLFYREAPWASLVLELRPSGSG
jgi:hypothetical protein